MHKLLPIKPITSQICQKNGKTYLANVHPRATAGQPAANHRRKGRRGEVGDHGREADHRSAATADSGRSDVDRPVARPACVGDSVAASSKLVQIIVGFTNCVPTVC